MDKQQFSVATITWARDVREEQLLRESLAALAELQMPVFISDGGSGPDFLAFLRSYPHFTLLPAAAKGVWAQARSSLQAAYAAGMANIFYTEPDKADFFRQALPHFLDAAGPSLQGILVASRQAGAFASFPAFQQMTETTINRCCAEVLGRPLDYTYGPFLLPHDLVPYLDLVTTDIGWGWRPYLFGIAHRLGLPVHAWEGPFPCPADQQQDNAQERRYRMRQLNQNIQGLLLSATVELP
jgi:hypothetical protein